MKLNLLEHGEAELAKHIRNRVKDDKWRRGTKLECFVTTTGRLHCREAQLEFKSLMPTQWWIGTYTRTAQEADILGDLKTRLKELQEWHG